MAQPFFTRLKHAWNAFRNKDPTYPNIGTANSTRPDRTRYRSGSDRTLASSVYTRIALDCAAIDVKHVQLDDSGRYLEDIHSGLNRCLTLEANLDQSGRAFMQDVVMSLLDEGCVAIVPVDTDVNPTRENGKGFDILTMRVAKVLEWYPEHIRVQIYNQKLGRKDEIRLPKRMCAIVENPLYAVMNEPNSTMQRLIRKLSLLDGIDEQSSAGKLDLLIQLPYIIKTEARRQQAEQRRKDIEEQLAGSKYGIAYTDGTEKVTQLSRPIENNLMSQIEYLTNQFYSQLGITATVMDGTADDKTMLNYYNRTIEPILSAITCEMTRKFLTDKQREDMESIMAFRDPFTLVPVNSIAEIADKFTRNEIMTSNEIRQVIGMKPSQDPNADILRNKNLSASPEQMEMDLQNYYNANGNPYEMQEIQNEDEYYPDDSGGEYQYQQQ